MYRGRTADLITRSRTLRACPPQIVRTWLGDTISGNSAISNALKDMRVSQASAEGKDVHMATARPPHNARFELVPRTEGRAKILVPHRQALEEAVEGRAANCLLTTKSDTTAPDHFLLSDRFLSEYLSTRPTAEATPGTYNVQRPYSDEFGYFSSDSMFASSCTRRMLPAPDASEGVLPGFGIYELVSGFHELLHDTFNFFTKECVEVDLDSAYATGPLLFVGAFEDVDRGVYAEAAHCHSAERAKLLFQQFNERCGPVVGRNSRVVQIKTDRWGFYQAMLKSLSQVIPFQKRNQALSFTRQLMRLITQEKHHAQVNRHVRLVSAEIKSLANKMEVLHTGKDMAGEPLFGGQGPVAYTVDGVWEAFRTGAQSLGATGETAPKTRRVFGKQSKAQATPAGAASAEQTVGAIFKKQRLNAEVIQALTDLILSSKFIHERSSAVQETITQVPIPTTTTPGAQPRGARILRLIFESGHDMAPILRRIAGYIYTPAFDRCYLPVIVQTQVAHQTRAHRKVGTNAPSNVHSFIFYLDSANRRRSSGTKSPSRGGAEARLLRAARRASARRRREAGFNRIVAFTMSSPAWLGTLSPLLLNFRRRGDRGPRGAGAPLDARVPPDGGRPLALVRLVPPVDPLAAIKESRMSPIRSS